MVRLRRRRPEPEPEPEPEAIDESDEDDDGLVTSSLVALHVTLPARHKGHRPPRGTVAEMAAGAHGHLTCAGLSASWSRKEDVMSWYCEVVACDPPMADGPLRNAEALRGCASAVLCAACPARSAQQPPLARSRSRRCLALIPMCGASSQQRGGDPARGCVLRRQGASGHGRGRHRHHLHQ